MVRDYVWIDDTCAPYITLKHRGVEELDRTSDLMTYSLDLLNECMTRRSVSRGNTIKGQSLTMSWRTGCSPASIVIDNLLPMPTFEDAP